VCADIVQFPGKPKVTEIMNSGGGAVVLQFAIEVRQLILEGAESGWFDGTSSANSSTLNSKLHARYGAPLAAAVGEYFEYIYGCDPVTFLEHVTSYRG